MASDLSGRPMLTVIQPVNFVNAVGIQHGSVVKQRRGSHQRDVVGKTPKERPARAQRPVESRLANELSCCLQDARHPLPTAKLRPPNALSPKLRCCLQDAPVGASDRAGVVAGGSAPPPGDGVGGTASNSPDAGHATCVDSPDTLVGRRDRKLSSAGDSRADVAADSWHDCMRTGEGKKGRAETVGGSSGSGDRSSGGSRSGCEPFIVSASRLRPEPRRKKFRSYRI